MVLKKGKAHNVNTTKREKRNLKERINESKFLFWYSKNTNIYTCFGPLCDIHFWKSMKHSSTVPYGSKTL